MDIITHAIVGGVTGASFGAPLTGVVFGIFPDLALVRNKAKRTWIAPTIYRAYHSFGFVLANLPLYFFFEPHYVHTIILALLSHQLLDIFTHRGAFAAQPLWPLSTKTFYQSREEWEFFNRTWWKGLALASGWVLYFSHYSYGAS